MEQNDAMRYHARHESLDQWKPLCPPHGICGGSGVFMQPSDVETFGRLAQILAHQSS
ncbi:hypothetical protein K492DRAFT_176549, partial [Lichtheimia hyalospora FSU 10163]